MTFALREYQREALDVIHTDLQTSPEVLFQACTGAGKTVTVCRLINRYWFETDRRFLVLAHKQELVDQFARTFEDKTDIPAFGIGQCCAGLNSWDASKRLTIATVQTMIGQLDNYPGCDLLVCDESHRVEVGTNSQYDQVIAALRRLRPNMRILGVTATPFRLGHGYTYGDRCKPGSRNLFPQLNHKIKYSTLLEQGYLVPLRGMVAHADTLTDDLAACKVQGDYVLDQLGEIMAKEIHLATAVEAIEKHCEPYKHVCVFCCTIDHAEKLAKLLNCVTVHSQLSPLERAANLSAWKDGHSRVVTSVNILAEGFDFPPLDCLVMARPTMSAGLYIQAVGRALRTYPGKDHAFILDLTDNTARFGTDLDRVKITIPKVVEDALKKKNRLIKICPQCEAEVFVSLRVCQHCEFEWPVEEILEANAVPELKEVAFEPVPPEWVSCTDVYPEVHFSKAKNKYLGRIRMYFGGSFRPRSVSIWLCFEDFYTGFATQKGREWWERLAPGMEYPKSCEEFEELIPALLRPTEILIDTNGEYPELIDIRISEVPF